jgi:DNA-binding GntR family transcriptional regulator
MSSATRAELIAARIRDLIRGGTYLSGDRLVELTLSHQMDVSQNTVRDALRLLEGEGWVVKHARHGVYVREFQRSEAEELYALWSAVEGLALQWALAGAKQRDLASLRRSIQQAHLHSMTGDLQGAEVAIFEFHARIADLSERSQTRELLMTLRNRVYLLEIKRQMRSPRTQRAQETRLLLYEKLVTLIENGDSENAAALLAYLIRDNLTTLLPLMNE